MNTAQIRRNQHLFASVNERIAEITQQAHDRLSEFVCECGSPKCASTIRVSLDEHADVRSRDRHFIVASGHCVQGVDRLVETRDGYDIVVAE